MQNKIKIHLSQVIHQNTSAYELFELPHRSPRCSMPLRPWCFATPPPLPEPEKPSVPVEGPTAPVGYYSV
ncbi:hypothetical protein FF1_005178 [Malus domestica]